ncbi:MAG TPA: META domain-containing protein [Microvirga sp.]|jgi:heat shock protein HslJ|nr:META domain-containing protein [Microvirga sp.]
MTLLRMAAAAWAALMIVPAAQAQTSAPAARPPQGQAVQPPKPRQQDKIFPLGATWVAVSLNGRPFSGERPSFTLSQQFRATGFSGCNTYSSTAYPLREQTLAVAAFALTKNNCPAGAKAVEQQFLTALRSSQKWDQQGSTLIIQTGNGELRFERAL